MWARNGLGGWIVASVAAAAAATIAVACGGGGEAPPQGGGPASGGGGEQSVTTPEQADDAGAPSVELDAGPPVTVVDAGPVAADAQPAVTDAGVASTDGDGGAAPTPEERWRAMVRRGRSKFNSVCGTCHPGGNEDIGPRIRGVGFSTSRMRRQIRSGSGRMRPIGPGRVSEADLENLFAYLSTMGAVRGVQRPQ